MRRAGYRHAMLPAITNRNFGVGFYTTNELGSQATDNVGGGRVIVEGSGTIFYVH